MMDGKILESLKARKYFRKTITLFEHIVCLQVSLGLLVFCFHHQDLLTCFVVYCFQYPSHLYSTLLNKVKVLGKGAYFFKQFLLVL